MADEEKYTACIDIASYGTAGAVATVLIPLTLVGVSFGFFLRWQFAAAMSLPAPRLIPDLEASRVPASQIKCEFANIASCIWDPRSADRCTTATDRSNNELVAGQVAAARMQRSLSATPVRVHWHGGLERCHLYVAVPGPVQ